MPEVVLGALQILTHQFFTIAVSDTHCHSGRSTEKLCGQAKQLVHGHMVDGNLDNTVPDSVFLTSRLFCLSPGLLWLH